MLSMALAALRSRRAQSIALTLLSCLVIAGVVGTPYYLFAVSDRLVFRDQAHLPNSQRLVDMTQDITSTDGQPISGHVDSALSTMRDLLRVSGSTYTTSVVAQVTLSSNNAMTALNGAIAYIDNVCDHVRVQGRCPAAGTEGMVSETDAKKLNLAVGDTFTWPSSSSNPAPLIKIVGIYQPLDSSDAFWGAKLLAATQPDASESTGDAAFTTLDAMKKYAMEAVLDYRIALPVGHLSQLQIVDIDSRIADAQFQGPRSNISVATEFSTLVTRVNRDANNLLTTVPVLAVEALALGWFALFLVVRANVSNRRADTGLLRLRGVPRASVWLLMSAQSALPVLIATPIGVVLGYLGARALAGSPSSAERLLVLGIAAAATVIVVAGALLAALAASRRGRSGPVLEMLRDTPPRRRGWRSDAADIVVLGLAVFAIVQSHSTSAPTGLVILAPSLTALAIALILARSIAPVSAALVPRAIRSGRVADVLTTTYLARRPGLDRLFTLVMIVTALAVSSIVSWRIAVDAQHARARQEVGAARVVELGHTTPAEILALTHRIDPSGRYLMAAAQMGGHGADQVLAVDSPRLASVIPGRLPGVDLTSAAAGRLLRPAPPAGPTVTGATMTVTVAGDSLPAGVDTYVIAALESPAGAAIRVALGPLTTGSHDYRQPIAGCVPSCRVVSYFIATAGKDNTIVDTSGPASVTTKLTLQRVNGVPLGPAASWRTTLAGDSIGPVLTSVGGGLGVYVPNERYSGQALDTRIYPVNTPLPIPVLVAGALQKPTTGGSATITPFGGPSAPIAIKGRIAAIPRIGRDGIVVDMTYADVLSGGVPGSPTLEVWMAAGTPASMVRAVEGAPASVEGAETVAASIASYRDDSLEAAREYAMLGSVLGLALAVIAMVLVGAGERGFRSRELAALRTQGVGEQTMRRSILSGYAFLCGGAVVLGIVAAMIGRFISGGQDAIFSDGWSILGRPGPWNASGWLLATIATAVPILITATFVARALRRDVARRFKAARQ